MAFTHSHNLYRSLNPESLSCLVTLQRFSFAFISRFYDREAFLRDIHTLTLCKMCKNFTQYLENCNHHRQSHILIVFRKAIRNHINYRKQNKNYYINKSSNATGKLKCNLLFMEKYRE